MSNESYASSQYNISCKQARALNNLGVVMMLRGEFKAAIDTLEQAMLIMFRRISNCPQELQHFGQERIGVASARLSRMPQLPSYALEHLLRLSAIESDDVQALKKMALSPDPFSFVAVLIRDGSDSDVLDSRFSRDSGILLHNHGLACHLMAIFASCQNVSQLPEDHATKSLVHAHTKLARNLCTCRHPTEDLESYFLTIIVLRTVGKMYEVHNDMISAMEADEAVDTLLSASRMKVIAHLTPSNGTIAAAAA